MDFSGFQVEAHPEPFPWDEKENLGQPAGLECSPKPFQPRASTNLQTDPQEQTDPIPGATWDSGKARPASQVFTKPFQPKANINLQKDPQEQMDPIPGKTWDSGR